MCIRDSGRGGAGFSLLDVTDPVPSGSKGPIHMFSVYNDKINNKVLVADVHGRISELEYNATSTSLMNSLEGEVAQDNFNAARDEDERLNNSDATNNIAPCSTASDFRENGTASCFVGTTFYFPDIVLDYPNDETIPSTVIGAIKLNNGVPTPIKIQNAKMVDDGSGGSVLKVEFQNAQVFNANPSDVEPRISDCLLYTSDAADD